VKKPEESKGPWDYYKQLATIPAEEAWRPIDQAECPLGGSNTRLQNRGSSCRIPRTGLRAPALGLR
jgi:hypothetical protein